MPSNKSFVPPYQAMPAIAVLAKLRHVSKEGPVMAMTMTTSVIEDFADQIRVCTDQGWKINIFIRYIALFLTLLCGDVDETHSLYPVPRGVSAVPATAPPCFPCAVSVWRYGHQHGAVLQPHPICSRMARNGDARRAYQRPVRRGSNEVLAHCDAVLSGYLGSAEQGTRSGGGGRGQGSQSCRHLFLRSG